MTFHVVLINPEIPANAGNIIRLAANIGFRLHLAEPLGFSLQDRHLRRAGLDYHDLANVQTHESAAAAMAAAAAGRRFVVIPNGAVRYDKVAYESGDAFVFGRESDGLPAEMVAAVPPARRLYIPMRADNRSVNLSNAVAIVAMEVWRRLAFVGAAREN